MNALTRHDIHAMIGHNMDANQSWVPVPGELMDVNASSVSSMPGKQ
jgi:hypothetical protein